MFCTRKFSREMCSVSRIELFNAIYYSNVSQCDEITSVNRWRRPYIFSFNAVRRTSGACESLRIVYFNFALLFISNITFRGKQKKSFIKMIKIRFIFSIEISSENQSTHNCMKCYEIDSHESSN